MFIDPFGGRPWQEPLNYEVSKRILNLNNSALYQAQKKPKSRYYGSGFVVKNSLMNQQCNIRILVSDRDELALSDLIMEGFEQFKDQCFQKENAFTILDCQLSGSNPSLILIDPYADFIDEAEKIFPKIANFIEKTNSPLALYLLNDERNSDKFSILRKKHFSGQFNQLSLYCPKLLNTSVKGESKYSSEILLLLPKKRFIETIDSLKVKLNEFSIKLSKILDTTIIFHHLT